MYASNKSMLKANVHKKLALVYFSMSKLAESWLDSSLPRRKPANFRGKLCLLLSLFRWEKLAKRCPIFLQAQIGATFSPSKVVRFAHRSQMSFCPPAFFYGPAL
ncbi:hypothetical protein GOP47_0023135 [Adiantum capillus-veneris]|uniref:Uncharacterized protein n=1 Tax=Adiantum capillus-veneris TaxID=13818 RepID=A0A9D4U920_ADICA|nr:hypothetical protein GOP47_0023135 [Adiantum capillus-veneris]